ncbi:MAG: thermonuclease family protein [Gammaproteobacteria bacterium]
MLHRCSAKGVPGSGAPFFCQLLPGCLLAFSLAPVTLADSCAAGHISERVRVVHVYDGDTVKLEDGRRLRFIGINTPETGHHDQPGQPHAKEAQERVQKLLETHNHTLLLQAGRQQHDHYGRLLAHAFLDDGDNLAVRLLQEGLATTLVVPPNTWGQRCYQRHEDRARRAGLGLWRLDAYKTRQSQALPRDTRGFRIIRGKVQEVQYSRHNVRLNLEGKLVIHIGKKDIENFEPGFLDGLQGQRIETRGWVRPVKNTLQIKVRHPAALLRIPAV